MGLKETFQKLEVTLNKKLVQPLRGTRSTYTATSKSAQCRMRISDRILALTPEIAEDMRFTEAGGYIGQAIAFGAYWRGFRVEVASFSAAMQGRGANRYPFDIAVTIEVGYPAEPGVIVAGVTYEGADLKSHDDEQIDKLMRGGDLLSNPTAIADAQVVSLESAFDLGNTVRRHRYVMHVTRVYA